MAINLIRTGDKVNNKPNNAPSWLKTTAPNQPGLSLKRTEPSKAVEKSAAPVEASIKPTGSIIDQILNKSIADEEAKSKGYNPNFVRNNPVLSRILYGTGNLLTKPFDVLEDKSSFAKRFRQEATNRLTGNNEELATTGNKALDFLSSVGGAIAGYTAPLPGIQGQTLLKGSQLVSKPVEQAVSKKVGGDVLGKLVTGAAREATEGAVLGGFEGLMQGKDTKGIAKQAATDGLIGGIFGAGLEGAGTLIKKGAKNIPVTAADETAVTALKEEIPAPRPKDNVIPFPQQQPAIEAVQESAEKLRSFPDTVKTSELASPELKKLIKENPQMYQPITNEETLKVAQSIIDENFDAAKSLVLDGKSFENATEAAMGQDIVRRLQSEGRWEEAFDVMKKVSEKFTTAGQTVQAAAMWRRTTPEGMLKYASKVFDDANKQLPAGKKIKLDPDLQEKIVRTMEQVGQIEDDTLKDLTIGIVLDEIQSQVPVSLGRKLSTIQAMSHLLNAKTTLRNIFGNTAFLTAEKLSNLWAIPFDKAFAKYTGKRTVTTPQLKDSFKAGVERAKDAARDVKLGIDSQRLAKGKYDIFQGPTFREGKSPLETVLAKGEKALSYALKVPDEFYKGVVQSDALQQMTKAAGIDAPTPEMLKQAEQEALYATFQDDSLPAQILQGAKEVANKIGVGKTVRGSKVYSTKEFGLGDFLIKYTKVPGNIISRAIEYTPAGAVKALKLIHEAKKTGALNQRELSLTLGRALNGSMMIGLGAWMANNGILISQDKDRDKDAKALEQAEGLGNYKVNVDALERIIQGGDGTPQSGDELFSYDWMQPISAALAMGAIIDRQRKKEGSPIQTLNAIGANSIEEILDLPTLYIIQQMMYEGMREDSTPFTIAAIPVTEGVPGFVPSVVRQLSQTSDPVARQTGGENILENLVNKTKANVPGFREDLQPRISPFGQEVKYPNDIISTLINPAQKSVYRPNPSTQKLQRIEDLTGITSHYPQSNSFKKINIKNTEIQLTDDQRTRYQEIAGKVSNIAYNKILDKIDVNTLTPQQAEKIAKYLENINRQARELAKKEIIRGIINERKNQ